MLETMELVPQDNRQQKRGPAFTQQEVHPSSSAAAAAGRAARRASAEAAAAGHASAEVAAARSRSSSRGSTSPGLSRTTSQHEVDDLDDSWAVVTLEDAAGFYRVGRLRSVTSTNTVIIRDKMQE